MNWKFYYSAKCPLSVTLVASFNSFCEIISLDVTKVTDKRLIWVPALVTDKNDVIQGRKLYDWIVTNMDNTKQQNLEEPVESSFNTQDNIQKTTLLFDQTELEEFEPKPTSPQKTTTKKSTQSIRLLADHLAKERDELTPPQNQSAK